MKKLVTALVFCTLLLISILADDDGRDEKDGKDSEDDFNVKSGVRLRVFIYANLSIHITYNENTQTVVVLDHGNNRTYWFNGKVGSVYIFNDKFFEWLYMPPGASNRAWNIKRQSYNKYFKDPSTLQELLPIARRTGIAFDADSTSKEIIEGLDEVSVSFGLKTSPCRAVGSIFQKQIAIYEIINTPLKGLDVVFGDVQTDMTEDFAEAMSVFVGLADFFGPFDGGISALIQKQVTLDFNTVWDSPSGYHNLVYLCNKTAVKFDLGKILGKSQNDPVSAFGMISHLGINNRVGGVTTVISQCLNYISQINSQKNLFIYLDAYFKQPKNGTEDLDKELETSIKYVLTAFKALKLENSFKAFCKTLQDILDKNWVVKGVNMSAIIEVCVKPPGNDPAKAIFTELNKNKGKNDAKNHHKHHSKDDNRHDGKDDKRHNGKDDDEF